MEEAQSQSPSHASSQFKLWHMMVVTFWAASTIAIGRLTQPLCAVILSLVAATIWMNAFGWFASIQERRRIQFWVMRVALGMWVLSMFLPAVPTFVRPAVPLGAPANAAPVSPPTTPGWRVAQSYLPIFIRFDEIEPLVGVFFGLVGLTNPFFLIWFSLIQFHDPNQSGALRRLGYLFFFCACCNFVIVGLLYQTMRTSGMALWTLSFLLLFSTVRWNVWWAAAFSIWIGCWMLVFCLEI